jgi:hypothetical protein
MMLQVTVNMLFKENITTKEQMVNWLNKRRPAHPKGEIYFQCCGSRSWPL